MGYEGMYGFILALLLVQILQIYAKVPAIIVFGDSSVDSGNNNQVSTVLKSNFQPYGRDFISGKPTGRFSNGRIPTDFISEAFKIKPTIPAYLDPTYNITDFATGVCFASAGTGFDNATSDVLSVIPLWKEMEYYKEYQEKLRDYLGNEKANELIREALYLISIGTNDFLENYYVFPRRSSEYSIEEYQNFLAGIAKDFITELYQLGAQNISLSGLPPMGCLPMERMTNIFSGNDCVEDYNNVAKELNEKLQGMIMKLNKELTGIRLVFSNPYDILLDIILLQINPSKCTRGELVRVAAYCKCVHSWKRRFEDVATACCGTGYFEMGYMCAKINPFTCSDASKYVFWDSFHPTEKTNWIIADHVVKTSLADFL